MIEADIVVMLASGTLAVLNAVWAGLAVFAGALPDESDDVHILWAKRYAYAAAICSIVFTISLLAP